MYALQTLSGHPDICQLNEIYSDEDVFCLLMDRAFCNMAQFLESAGPIESDVQALMTKSLASGLQHMHRHWILHRDLKPLNILMKVVGVRFTPQLADFGSCAILEPPADLPENLLPVGMAMSRVVTTYNYGAPEIFGDDMFYCFGSDMWSCAIIVAEMMQARPIVQPMKFGDSMRDKVNDQVASYLYDMSLKTPGNDNATCEKFVLQTLVSDPSVRMSAEMLHQTLLRSDCGHSSLRSKAWPGTLIKQLLLYHETDANILGET